MRYLVTALLLAAAVLPAGCSADDNQPVLPGLQWHYRVIVSFTDSAERADTLVNAFKSSPGFAERDIAWFVVGPDTVVSNLDDVPDRTTLERLHTVDGFQSVLVGKDGTLKASQLGGLDIQALLDDIDQMPMRQNEMNQ